MANLETSAVLPRRAGGFGGERSFRGVRRWGGDLDENRELSPQTLKEEDGMGLTWNTRDASRWQGTA